MKNYCVLEISNGGRKIRRYRNYFEQEGFSFVKRSYGKSYYTKKCKNATEREGYVSFCKRHRLKCNVLAEEYVRSSNYRKTYFDSQNFTGKYTICTYCGLPVRVEKLTVDHIIPVDKVKKTTRAKIMMKLFGITDVNELKNLCSACKRCNSKKRAKMGIWIIRGFIGKSKFIWCIRWILRIIILYWLICFLYQI